MRGVGAAGCWGSLTHFFGEDSVEQLGQYLDDGNTKDDLQEFCRDVELSASGTKAELVKRILAALGEAMAEEFYPSLRRGL